MKPLLERQPDACQGRIPRKFRRCFTESGLHVGIEVFAHTLNASLIQVCMVGQGEREAPFAGDLENAALVGLG